jgi:hypothetical protein
MARRRDGEHCSPRSTRCLPTKTKATHIDLRRSTVLGGGVPAVDWLARTPGLRPSRHGRPLAARTVSQVLGSAVESEPARSRPTSQRAATPGRIHTPNGSWARSAEMSGPLIILNVRHLKRTLASCFSYCHGSRTHLGLDKQCRFPRQVSGAGRFVQDSRIGGLHHRYERVAV